MKLFKSEKRNGEDPQTKSVTEDNSLIAAIEAVRGAQAAIGRYMKQRADAHLANTGLQTPMRVLKEVEAKLKSYVKN